MRRGPEGAIAVTAMIVVEGTMTEADMTMTDTTDTMVETGEFCFLCAISTCMTLATSGSLYIPHISIPAEEVVAITMTATGAAAALALYLRIDAE